MSASASCLMPFSCDQRVIGVFCACFVLFESSMKPRETAVEQEILQAAYSFLK